MKTEEVCLIKKGTMMFREIRNREQITETSKKDIERKALLMELFDSRIGSDRWKKLNEELKELDEETEPQYDPDEMVWWM